MRLLILVHCIQTMVGLEKYKIKQFDSLDLPANPRLPLDQNAKFLKGAGVKL